MSTDFTDEHPGIATIRKYVEADMFDPSAQQSAPQAQPAQDAAPQGPQAMDFAGQEGASPDSAQPAQQPAPQQNEQPAQAPAQQSAPPAQNEPASPAPFQHTPITQLNTPQIMGAYNNDIANTQQNYNAGIAQQANAAKQTTAVNMANNDANQQALQDIARVDSQFQSIRNGVDAYHMNVTQQAVSDQQNDVNAQMQMLNSNPHDFWGNSSTTNKIGAIIGMVGAGLHGDNASEYFNKIVDQRVAESARKQHALQVLSGMHDKSARANDKAAGMMSANVDAQKSAAYQAIGLQLKQRLAMTKNPQEIANLTDTLGKLQEKAALHDEKGAQDRVKDNLNGLKTQLEVEHNAMEMQDHAQATQQTKEPKDPNNYLALGAFKGRGVQSVVYKEAAEKISSSEAVVQGIDQARALLKDPSINSAYGLRQVNAQILSELRKLQGTGANLSPEEVKNIEALTPAWGDVARGTLSLVDFDKRLTAAQRLVSNSAMRFAKNVGAPENELNESSPLYAIEHGAQEEKDANTPKQMAQSILNKYPSSQ